MAIIKCKMCGGDIDLSADKTYGVCEFCGSTMTLPKVDDEQRAAAFNRGNHFRRIGEFDKALTVYESLVRDNEEDAEAHWCCALCRFGIEYVKDPASGEYMPTCHRASFDSFLEDVDTKEAIEHADAVAKRQYEHDAQVIEEVRRGILTLSQNEQPYDVFICYKETDDRGQRTIDSQRAQEIYYQLTDQGRRVFFARITLEDKAGQQYEPYIFAALNSARVMIVVGTRREHLEAVWVKNEWSRFLAIMKRDRKKLLIPCYADMDPYDMPEQLSVLQSYDMTKIGFIQDLTRGISKVLDADKKPVSAPSAQELSMTNNVNALIKRGYMSLEDRDWKKADDFFEQVLNQDAECAEAYMGKALAEYGVTNLRELVSVRMAADQKEEKKEEFSVTTDEKRVEEAIRRWEIPNYLSQSAIREKYEFRESYGSTVKYWTEAKAREEKWWDSERNLVRARKYASGAYKQELENGYKDQMASYEEKISEAAAQCDSDKKALEQKFAQFNDNADKRAAELYADEIECRERDYADACEAQAKAEKREDIDGLLKIVKDFASIGNFKDCPERQEDCYKLIDAIREKRRMEEANDAVERKRQIIKFAIISALAVIGIVIAVFVGRHIHDFSTYKKAESLLAEGKRQEAAVVFGKIPNYKDAAERSRELWKEFTVLISAGDGYTVGLKSDGTVVAVGFNDNGRCDVYGERWTDIIAVSAGSTRTVGLKSDGTVVAVGYFGFASVSDWRNITAISAGNRHVVGLKSDGTVVAAGYNGDGQCDVSSWTDIVAISAGGSHTVGLKSDGTVVAVGSNNHGECDVSRWRDIVAISAGYDHTVGLRSAGTVIATGSYYNKKYNASVSHWTDIVAISAGNGYTVGLKSDGTVVAEGDNSDGQCNVSDWTDIWIPEH